MESGSDPSRPCDRRRVRPGRPPQARAFYKTVVVVEVRGVIADDRAADAGYGTARYWNLWGDADALAAAGDGPAREPRTSSRLRDAA